MPQVSAFFRRLFSGNNTLVDSDAVGYASKARIIPRDQHPVSRKDISPSALKVLKGLHDAGHQAYLVGGGVRDLLLGLKPKDFDVATDATPEQVKKCFRNSRIIGRRFRLVHVFYGRENIEVATFRAATKESVSSNQALSSTCPDSGMITRDNRYGTIEEDAIRRDFTVNALYYNIADFSVVDFLGGVEDLHSRQMNIIGEPATRYREDPVRMLRAVRLSTKLGFTIAEHSEQPIPEMAPLLQQVSHARLWDESLKLFLYGHAQETWHKLKQTQLAASLFPQTIKSLQSKNAAVFRAFIEHALASTDERIHQGKPVTPAFLFAVWLWQPMLDRQQNFLKKHFPPAESFNKACSQILAEHHQQIAMPRRFSTTVREIWQLQNQLWKRQGKRHERVFAHPRFRAAYDFLLLRAVPGSEEEKLAQWWTDYQQMSEGQRLNMVKALNRQTRRKPRRKPKTTPPPTQQDHQKNE